MLHSTLAKIERRTSSTQRESKKIYSSALQNVPGLKRGGEENDYIILHDSTF